MIPSDHFVYFYNEIFKFLERKGKDALQRYYDRVSERQSEFCYKLFKTGVKGMHAYFERIRIEENCDAFRTITHGGLVYEGGQNVCPSLSKVMDSDAGPCGVYCDHCPAWELPIFTKAGYYNVYNLISRTKPCCHEFVTAFENRPLAEDQLNAWLEEYGDDLIRTNLEPSLYRGTIANSRRFEGLHPRFKKAFAWLRETDLSALQAGRQTIDGDDVYANVMEVDLKPASADVRLEAHRAYVDIHVPISGAEAVGYVFDRTGEETDVFDEAGDCCTFVNPKMRMLTLNPGDFAVFMPPYGAHAPNLTAGEPRRHRKLVLKVRA